MAVDLRERGTVGCAYYVAREEKMYFMEDVRFGGVDVVETRMCSLFSALVMRKGDANDW
jgi:DNA mismatch repair protein MSH5